ncbi:MAG: glycosyltransferase family 9 protein [Gemmataceae bacterium]
MRIAIIKPSALGDIVHALPLAAGLRRRFPHAHMSWVVNRGFAELLRDQPDIDAIVPFDRAALGRGNLVAMWRFLQELRRQRFQIVIDAQGLFRTGVMTAATGAPLRIGFANAREGARHFYSHAVPAPTHREEHAVDRLWRLGAVLEVEGPKVFRLGESAIETAAVQELLRPWPRPWLVVAPGSKWATKQWPLPAFANLLHDAEVRYGGTAIIVGSGDDRLLAEQLRPHLRRWLDLTGKTTLPRLTALLRQADLMLGNDTGPLHLAAALGVPCLAPYTCTLPRNHGPYGQIASGAVATTAACGGSYFKQCPHGRVCNTDLTPDRLRPFLHTQLASWAATSRSA